MYNKFMKNNIERILKEEKIEYFGIIPFSLCKIINQPLLERKWGDKEIKSAIMLLVPYYTGEYPDRNISLYAVSRDYHLYFNKLYERLIPQINKIYPNNTFVGFADNSPIGETGAAAIAGLGVIGDKSQLINSKYGSYTFIGEILTDLVFDSYDVHEISFCNHCGECTRACPVDEGCFSGLTQKKGILEKSTADLIKKTGSVWGCDICGMSCPMNKNISKTSIEFFYDKTMPLISSEIISKMPKEKFEERAFAWKGKNTILRNLTEYEKIN